MSNLTGYLKDKDNNRLFLENNGTILYESENGIQGNVTTEISPLMFDKLEITYSVSDIYYDISIVKPKTGGRITLFSFSADTQGSTYFYTANYEVVENGLNLIRNSNSYILLNSTCKSSNENNIKIYKIVGYN